MGDAIILDPAVPIEQWAADIVDLAYDKATAEHMHQYTMEHERDPQRPEQSQYNAEAGAYEADIAGEFDYIPARFAQFFVGDLAMCEAMKADLKAAEEALLGVETTVNTVNDRMSRWDGEAATDFEAHFVNPMPTAVIQQRNLIREVHEGVDAHRRLLVASRESAKQIAMQTYAALYDYPSSVGKKEAALSVVGTIGAVVGVALAVPTGGVSLMMSLLALGTASVDTGTKLAQIQGGTVRDIIDSMNDALNALQEDIAYEDDVLRGKMAETLTKAGAFLSGADDMYLRPRRPQIADAEHVDRGDFTPE